MKTEIFTTIEGGKLQQYAARKITDWLGKNSGRVKITLERARKNRSNQQNRYYWGVVVNCFVQGWEETQGEKISKEEAHEIIKYQCNYREDVIKETGEIIRRTKSTSDNNTLEFEEMNDRARKLCFNWFNITVPLPNEQVLADLDFE